MENIEIFLLIITSSHPTSPNNDHCYQNMQACTSNYYEQMKKSYNGKFHYFYTSCNPNQLLPVEITSAYSGIPTITIQCEESPLNILKKTIESLKLISYLYPSLNKRRQFFVRTNVSTVINIQALFNYISSTGFFHQYPRIYSSMNFLQLQWLDPDFGIHDDSLFGLLFAQGTFILLSQSTVELLCSVDNHDLLDYSIIDDVSIGKFVHQFNKHIESQITDTNDHAKIDAIRDNEMIYIKLDNGNGTFLYTTAKPHFLQELPAETLRQIIVFRNKNICNRLHDVELIDKTCKWLQQMCKNEEDIKNDLKNDLKNELIKLSL